VVNAKPGELPTGTITFVFTDIEGSTRLTQQLGAAWPPLLERHRQIARKSWAQHHGVEVGTEGDSFFVVFTSATAAVQAAVQTQRDLAAEPWPEDAVIRVRIGLHTGEGQLSGGSYAGLDVHRAARIAHAGHGGQVLLSAATTALVEGALPEGVTTQDLGEYRLKDLSRPEHISELVIDGLPHEFPPLQTLDAVRNNLPSQLTSFLGRRRELTDALGLLAEGRLVTLTGPGGTGKTRLALQTAAMAADRYADGVFFVALGTVTNPSLVLPTMAQTLGLATPGGHPKERLASYLAPKNVLLVLDNLEQVIDAGPDIADVLRLAPHTSVLATSRSALRVYGERELPVPSLAVPDLGRLPVLGELSTIDAVALFVERARGVRPDFQLTEGNASAVAEICARLDGLPLAIELAAARVRVLSPEAIASRLDRRLALLSGGARDLPARQQTLRGAIEWSHDLLGEDDRRFFARFSVFAGGATLTAVESVLFEPDRSAEAFDAVESLLDKSLLRREPLPDAEPRFTMLETIREFAREKLQERDETDQMSERHTAWVVEFAEHEAASVLGTERRTALDHLESEHDNIRAALSWAIDSGRDELALRIFSATWRFWQTRGFLAEARGMADRITALPHAADHPEAWVNALEAAGGIAYWQGDLRASKQWYARALELERATGDERRVANALYNLSFPLGQDGDSSVEAIAVATEALEIYRRLRDHAGIARATWGLCTIYFFTDDIERGMAYAREALKLFQGSGDVFMTGWAHYLMASFNLTVDLGEARRHLQAAHRLFSQTNDRSGHSLVFETAGALLWLEGDVPTAMRLAGYAGTVERSTGTGLGRYNREHVGFRWEPLMDDPALAQAYEEGRRLSFEEATELAFGGSDRGQGQTPAGIRRDSG
jgi:predicted ATPase/class 3 adenylate cyclase